MISRLRQQLAARLRLLTAAFGPLGETQAEAPVSTPAFEAHVHPELLAALNTAGEAAGIQVWEWDIEQNLLHFNHHVLDRYGGDVGASEAESRPEALIGRAVCAEDLPRYRETFVKAVKGEAPLYIDYRVTDRDGALHPVQLRGAVFRDPATGRATRVVGFTFDMTEHAQNAERIAAQAEQQRQLIDRLTLATESANLGSWEIDWPTKRFMWVDNPIRSLGLRADDYASLEAFANHVVPEHRGMLNERIRAALADGTRRFNFRYGQYGADGGIVHVQTYGRVIVDDAGKPKRVLGVSRDVTSEVLAEEQLREQARLQSELLSRLGFALQTAGISLWEFDLKLNRYSWTGRRLPILGLDDVPIEEFYEGINRIILPEDFEHIHRVPRETIAAGKDSYTACYRVRGVDGEIHHLQNAVRILRSAHGRAYKMVGITWDVTDEVAAQEQLRQQAERAQQLTERLNMATESAGISSWEIDLADNRFLWVENRIVTVTRGLEEDQNLLTFFERILPEDRDKLRNAIRAARNENSDRVAFRYRVYGNKNEVVHVQSFARLISDSRGKPVRLLGVSWDITKEIEAAELLRDAERRLERASLSSSEGHWEADLATQRLWCSSSFHALLGYPQGDLATDFGAMRELVHESDRAGFDAVLKNHLSDNAPYDVEARLRTAAGDFRWFRLRGMAERSPDGAPRLMAGSIQDVHQQKLVEDALALAQRRFERAIRGTQDGLWELDVATGRVWVSPRVEALTGYAAAQFATSHFLKSIIHRDDVRKLTSVTRSHYRDNAPFDVELRMRTASGEHRWFRARATAERDAKSRAIHLSGSLQDVAEARAAREDLVRATQVAEAANRAKSAFLANVSHEIRTPMNGIVGMTELMLETELTRAQRDYANTIRGSADSLLTVINDILDFSKIEAGKLELERIELDIRQGVEDVAAMLALQAAKKNLELVVDVAPDLPARVLGDPQRLRQCLINLMGNAIKFTQHGEIVVRVAAERVNNQLLARFEIRDTGIGIAVDTLKSLFQPFVQADSSITRHFGGTGLGLSIVRRLVEMMGGEIAVTSEVGKGSTFRFTIPLDVVSSESEQTALRRSRILVIEASANVQRVLSALLSHLDQQVSVVADIDSARRQLSAAQANAQDFDLMIVDTRLPDGDALKFGSELARDPKFAKTRRILLTTLDRQIDARRLSDSGFAATLAKPVRKGELIECISRVLAGSDHEWHMRTGRVPATRVHTRERHRFRGSVLVVEDNPVNQKVAARFLELLGCSAYLAKNGAECLDACRKEHFDLVLMDLQMPVMDGVTATATLREWELTGELGERTPIVALTANAMEGDQERCATAGMDGFLTKPLDIDRLRDTLTKFGLQVSMKAEDAVDGELPPIDLARFNELADGDIDFANELAKTFITSGEEQLADIRAAVAVEDRAALARAAHRLKGACANIYADGMRELAARLETEAVDAAADTIASCVADLAIEFARAEYFLSTAVLAPNRVKAAS